MNTMQHTYEATKNKAGFFFLVASNGVKTVRVPLFMGKKDPRWLRDEIVWATSIADDQLRFEPREISRNQCQVR